MQTECQLKNWSDFCCLDHGYSQRGGRNIVDVTSYMAKEAETLKGAVEALSAGSGHSVEALHQVRVSTRRMRAYCWVLRHDQKTLLDDKLKALARQMKRLGSFLGHGRELDVCLEGAEKYHLDTRRVHVLRLRESRRIQLFVSRRWPKILGQMETLVALLGEMAPLPVPRRGKYLLPKSVRKHMAKWQKSHPHSKHEFHLLRMALRTFIYILKARRQPCPEKIVKFQKHLGQLHDLEVLKNTIKSTPELRKDRTQLERKTQKKYLKVLKSVSNVIRKSS
jgi:CHAD domain-containing protein